jgi:predicted nuclease of predicted toxin-antitoxin system
MRFLADESCDFAVVRALRDGGHEVLAVAEAARGARDLEVVRLAREEIRVLLTEDKDFGWYVYAAGEGGIGVCLIRFPAGARRTLGTAVLEAVRTLANRLASSFTVIEPGRVRVGTTPQPRE